MFGYIVNTSCLDVFVPWKVSSVVEQRLEFVRLAEAGGVPFAVLCRRFGIKRTLVTSGWLGIGKSDPESFEDRSRRPHGSPFVLRCGGGVGV